MRPIILLPAATVAGLTVEQLETVLAHEIAHIRRHDYLINILQVMVETLLFYHPAVWWVSSRVRLERELCCDDEVVRITGDALCYSRALTILERLRAGGPGMAIGSTGGPLSYRIRRLVGAAPRSRDIWPATPALALILTLAVMCVTGGVRQARAQQGPDTVTVEITRDARFAITSVRIVSGPAYLRPLAMRAAVMAPQMPQNISSPQVKRVETITFPAAFENPGKQQAIVTSFINDELAETESAVRTITGDSPQARQKLGAAKAKLAILQRTQSLVRVDQISLELPEMQWKVQVLRHHVQEFRKQYQGRLSLEPRYAQMVQALDAAERDLAAVGAR